MDELKYIKGLLREFFDIDSSFSDMSMSCEEFEVLSSRQSQIMDELEELSGFDKDE